MVVKFSETNLKCNFMNAVSKQPRIQSMPKMNMTREFRTRVSLSVEKLKWVLYSSEKKVSTNHSKDLKVSYMRVAKA